jgi:ParB family chromosome partitioning protein
MAQPETTVAKPAAKRNALGRGLGALLPGADDYSTPQAHATVEASNPTHTASPVGANEIPLAAVEANPYQPRTDFDTEALDELVESIRAQGVIQPITVREIEPGKYQLIAGERRTRASRLAGLATIPAYVRRANDEQMLEMALVENVQRADLNAMEVAIAYRRLMEELSLTIESVGERVGKKRATVNNYLRLLKLPTDIQAALRDGRLSMGHARALITLDSPLHQLELFRRTLTEGLSVRAVEDLVRRIGEPSSATPTGPVPKPATAKPTPSQLQLRTLERQLEERFGTKVSIRQPADGGPGDVLLKFYSTDDLNRLLELLG